MSAVPAMTPAAPAVTAQDLELEHAELLPARDTLTVGPLYPRYYKAPKVPCHLDLLDCLPGRLPAPPRQVPEHRHIQLPATDGHFAEP